MAVTDSILPSFSDVEVTPHDGYITMTINGVEFNLKTAASVSLISFSIVGFNTYQAEDGMTWAEWVASDYNTDRFVVSGNDITSGEMILRDAHDIPVSPTDTIQNGYDYSLGEPGGAAF